MVADNDVYVKITYPDDGDTVEGCAQVVGYTVVPDFSHYILEYGYGESPSFWLPIDTSTKMIADDVLGEWLVSFLEITDYALRVTVKTNAGDTFADTAVVYVKGIASGGWYADLTSSGSLSPAVGDIDGDGYDEVVVGVGVPWSGGSGGIEVFTHEGQRESGWPRDTDKNMMSSPALGDLDGDGIDDIVICCRQDGVRAYLSSSPDWIGSAGVGGSELWSLATPALADLENDGFAEVLTINDGGTVYAWRHDGQSVIPGNNGVFAYVAASQMCGFPCLAVADLDRDGENEVIGAAAYGVRGGIYIWDPQGNLLLGPDDYPDMFRVISGIAIANLDDTEDLEIAVFGGNPDYYCLSVFKNDGTQVPNFPIVLEDLPSNWWHGFHPAIGDLEGDGILEIVVSVFSPGGEGRIYGWHQDGTPLGSLGGSLGLLVSTKSADAEIRKALLSTLGDNVGEITARFRNASEQDVASLFPDSDDPVFASVAETFGSPILVDVNRDGSLDIVARAGCYYGTGYERVFAWDYEGHLISGFPLYVSSQASPYSFWPYTPVIVDLNQDGRLNLIVVSDWPDHRVVCWGLDAYYDSTKAHWPKYMHDKRNSGIFRLEDYVVWHGDANGDGIIGPGDVVYLINYLFRNGPAPDPLERGDCNCDGEVGPGDVVYLINYLFRCGPPPCP